MHDSLRPVDENVPTLRPTGPVPQVAAGGALEEPPTFLSVLHSIIASDARPPGFSGRQAIGLFDGAKVRWLLLQFKLTEVLCVRSDERLGAWGFDCTWILAAPGEPSALPEPGLPSLVDGDASLIDRIRKRNLQTRGPLADMDRLFQVSPRQSIADQILDLWPLGDRNLSVGLRALAIDLALRGTKLDPKHR